MNQSCSIYIQYMVVKVDCITRVINIFIYYSYTFKRILGVVVFSLGLEVKNLNWINGQSILKL